MNVLREGVCVIQPALLEEDQTALAEDLALSPASPGKDSFPFDSRSHCVLLSLCIAVSEGNGNILTRPPQGPFKHQASSPVQYCSS